MTHARTARRAFSLVELVIVMAIVAIIAAIAVPRYAGAGARYRAALAADRVKRDILYLRQRAMTTSSSLTISFADNALSYTLLTLNSPDAPGKPFTVVLSAEPYRLAAMQSDFGGVSTLTFNGFGVPSAGGSIKVGTAGYTRVITVDAGTGAVNIDPVVDIVTPTQLHAQAD